MGFNCSISHKVAVTAHLGEPATLIGAVVLTLIPD